ncbi:MAG: hypothetical protein WBF42_13755 [Terracidiphilus sp.]
MNDIHATPGFLLYLRGTAAIVMTVIGFFAMIGGIFYSQFTHIERYIGAVEGVSIALVFGGVTIALKTVERFQAAERHSLTD